MPSVLSQRRKPVSPNHVSELRQLLHDTSAELRTSTDVDYDRSVARWSKAAVKPAGLVVVPTTTEEVSIVVKYAAEENLDVAVKGGGHSTAGASSTDGGLLFDLDKMRTVRVDSDKKLFIVGGGANWGDVDQAAAPYNLATVGGTVADTGVGGLTLGGGYGWLSGLYGLSIDILIQCTVVLANGDVVTASEQNNADLFWALRGAGQNFGVATEFIFQAFDVSPDVYAGLLLFEPTPHNIQRVTEAVNRTYAINSAGQIKVAGRGTGGMGFMRPPGLDAAMIAVPIIYFGTAEQGQAVYRDFFDLDPKISTMSMVPYAEINKFLAPPYGLRASMKGAAFTLPLRPAFVQKLFEEYQKFGDGNDDAQGSILLWELLDTRKVTELDAGSFANRGTHGNVLICPIWTKPENDAAYREWARHINEKFKKELADHSGEEVGPAVEVTTIRGRKKATQFYGNYDHYDEKSKDIFGDNYEKLQALKTRYDPGNVFNKLFSISPLAN
ncbi:hypothetical protein H2200_010330 [Cladophialophora chaetospira]|uniref:FAD-binding PCMH-type domain-containing protein n=1 Tax=Cladophialophora chaetospira TaxID=386627 RepID=A0AA39CE43_9EURO|nr:hypothetical protein H2200_010330 [Cladophialophora chaetospira]